MRNKKQYFVLRTPNFVPIIADAKIQLFFTIARPLKYFSALVRLREQHPSFRWLSGDHATTCFRFGIYGNASDSGLGFILDKVFGLEGTIPMCGNESAFFLKYFFEFPVGIHFRKMGVPKIERLIKDVCLNIL